MWIHTILCCTKYVFCQSILSEGGLYTFKLVATEEVPAGDNIPSETASADVTIVVTDQNDQIPKFNQACHHQSISELLILSSLNIIIS